MASKFQIPIAFKSDPRGLKEAESALSGFGSKLAGIGAAVASAFAVRAVFNFGQEAILAAEGVATANARLEAIAKATQVFGAETNKVTKALIDRAEAAELVIAVDAEIIKGVQAQLLSFKKLSASAGEVGGVFDRVTKAAFDMAAAGFGSAESNAIALGKAFEDPIRGLTALRRSGTVFTEEQQELIKSLVESGDTLAAQTIILEELETQYGGTAEATANFSDRMALAFDNVKEALGTALLPTFERFATFFIEKVVPPLTSFFENDFPRIITAASVASAGLATALGPVGEAFRKALSIPEGASVLESLLENISNLPKSVLFQQLVESMVQLVPALLELIPPMTELVIELVPLLVATLPALIWFINALANVFGSDGLAGGLAEANEGQWGFVESAKNLEIAAEAVKTAITALATPWVALTNAINSAYNALVRFFSAQNSPPPAPRATDPNKKRAVGGPVSAFDSYVVGERGPEIFTPGAGGFITPNNRLGGGGSTNITITVNAGMGTNGAQLGEQIVSAIKRYERASGPVFASA